MAFWMSVHYMDTTLVQTEGLKSGCNETHVDIKCLCYMHFAVVECV